MKKKTSLNVGDRVYYKPTNKRHMVTTITDTGGHRDLVELLKLQEEGVVFYSADVLSFEDDNGDVVVSDVIVDNKIPKGFTSSRVLYKMDDVICELSEIHEVNPKEKVYVVTYYSDGTIVAGFARVSDGCVIGEDDFIIADYADKYVSYRRNV